MSVAAVEKDDVSARVMASVEMRLGFMVFSDVGSVCWIVSCTVQGMRGL